MPAITNITIPATLPTTWYAPHTFFAGRADEARMPGGIWTDHTSPLVEQLCYDLRNRQGTDRMTHQQVATRLGLRHWRDSYNATRNLGRRRDGENGRDTAGDLTYRSWNLAGQAAARAGTRAFGVEIEFNVESSYGLTTARENILRDMRAAGIQNVHDRWNRYGWDGRLGGWQGTYDTTVSGGELVSPPLTGDDGSMADLRTAFKAVRDHGGTHAASGGYGHNGLHVSHNVNDFDQADKNRLVHNLRNVADNLRAFNGSLRQSSRWAQPLSSHAWDDIARRVSNGGTGYDDHSVEFNFNNLNAGEAARIEFRGWGNSLNFTKTRVWIRVGQAIMTATKAGVSIDSLSQADMIDLLKQHGLSDWAADKWLSRTTNTG